MCIGIKFVTVDNETIATFCLQKDNIPSGSPLFVSHKRKPFVQAQFPLGLEQRVCM